MKICLFFPPCLKACNGFFASLGNIGSPWRGQPGCPQLASSSVSHRITCSLPWLWHSHSCFPALECAISSTWNILPLLSLCLFTSTTLSNPNEAIIVLVRFSLFYVPAESLSYLESSRSRCWMRIHVQVLAGRTMKTLGVMGKGRKAQCLSQSSEEQIPRWDQALESFIREMSIRGNG